MIIDGKVLTECDEGEIDCPHCLHGQAWPDEFNDDPPTMYSEATCRFCGAVLACHSVDLDEQGFAYRWNWMTKRPDVARDAAHFRHEEYPYKRGEV